MNPARTYRDRELLLRLLREARPFWLPLSALLLVGLLSAPLALLTPLPLKITVDSVLGSHPLPSLLRGLAPAGTPSSAALVLAVALLLVTALLKQLQDLGSRLLRAWTLERMTLDLRARVFGHAQRMSLSYHDRQGTSDSSYRIQRDVPDAQSILLESVFPSIAAGATLASMLIVMARLDLTLAASAVAISPLLFAASRYYRGRFRKRWREVKSLESSAMSVAHEALSALRVVKAFGQEEREHRRFIQRSGQGMSARLRLTAIEGTYGIQIGLLMAIGTAVVLFVGVRHVQANVLTLGELLIVMGYVTQLYDPLKTLSKKSADVQAKLASAERVFSLLDDPRDVAEKPNARPLARTRGLVTFDRVSFGYDDGRQVLTDVSFEIPPRARLGIAGPTGVGKTTLVNLLLRFYDPVAGSIRIDGTDLRDYRLADLRRQFAIVLQEPILFSASVAENIAYARTDAGLPAIVEAARAAHADEFIRQLPEGYGTLVGERGMRLSGGERQRISLARAFLKDAPILVLDEPTSAVDVATESLILDSLERLTQGRTTLMIAHRLSTLDICDWRLELEGGRVLGIRAAAVGGARGA